MQDTSEKVSVWVTRTTGAALDWLVCQAARLDRRVLEQASKDPIKAFKLLDYARVSITYMATAKSWWGCVGDPFDEKTLGYLADTRLEAGLRAYVIAKLGEHPEVPVHLTTAHMRCTCSPRPEPLVPGISDENEVQAALAARTLICKEQGNKAKAHMRAVKFQLEFAPNSFEHVYWAEVAQAILR